MASNNRGSKFHPSRISGQAKKAREREANKLIQGSKNKKVFHKVEFTKNGLVERYK